MTIFGRADLRISRSGAKFDEEADFDIRSAVGPPKPHQIDEKLTFRSENFVEKKIWRRKIEICKSSETRVPKFRADRNHVRGVNRRSKFAVAAIRRKIWG